MQLLTPAYYGAFAAQIAEMHRLRYRVFNERLDLETVNRKARCGSLTVNQKAESMKLAVRATFICGWRPLVVVALASYSGLTRWVLIRLAKGRMRIDCYLRWVQCPYHHRAPFDRESWYFGLRLS
jgi:hypothetical protein